MDRKIFHGKIAPTDIAQALLAEFDQGNLRAQMAGQGKKIAVQIGTRLDSQSGGQTALTVSIQETQGGVMVEVGQQAWMGVAASLGYSAFAALRNPLSLLGRLDDIAQDIESLQLAERAWRVVGAAIKSAGASHQLSEKLSRLTCDHCGVATPVGEPACIACGAPLGKSQPKPCSKCGFIVDASGVTCQNCGNIV